MRNFKAHISILLEYNAGWTQKLTNAGRSRIEISTNLTEIFVVFLSHSRKIARIVS
jgi:hypothetical protein